MPIHQACNTRLTGYVHSPEYQDIFCGTKIAPSALNLGSLEPLIHVSEGANLVFLELLLLRINRLAGRSRLGGLIIASMLLLFTAAHSCSPSTVRVTLSILLRLGIDRWQLRWTQSQRLTTAGVASLLFCRSTMQVPGLLTGWIASLALQIESSKEERHSHRLFMQVRLYLLLLPALMSITIPHPLSIVGFFLFYPGIGIGLFLCALIVFICPAFASTMDTVLDFAWRVFQELSSLFPPPWHGIPVPLTFLVLYLFALIAWRRHQELPGPTREPLA